MGKGIEGEEGGYGNNQSELGGGIIYDNLCVWMCHCCMNGAPVGDPPHLYATVKLWEISHRFSHEWESVGDLPHGKKR